jgi:MFS family permease
VTDRTILYAGAFLRATATGLAGILLGVHLARTGLAPSEIGVVTSSGLAGAALASAVAMRRADALGRRGFLAGLAALSAAGGVAAALSSSPGILAAAAFVGMLNGMGRDRGASLVLEQAMLPATASDAGRTAAFAAYNVLQDAGHALGSLLAALPALLHRAAGIETPTGSRLTLLLYAALFVALAPLALALSPQVEVRTAGAAAALSPESRRILRRIGALFAVDSLAGGFLSATLFSVFFYERFGVDESGLAPLFFAARILNALSHLAAAALARRFGLVNTMVFTHIPSSLLLATVPFAPSYAVAAVLFLLREGLVEMDVPTRQSYVMAVVRPEERTFASGLTHLVRMAAWAVAPAVAGLLMQGVSLATPLLVCAALKIAYDVALYRACRGTLPPEERDRQAGA